jgi:hypothetical protein
VDRGRHGTSGISYRKMIRLFTPGRCVRASANGRVPHETRPVATAGLTLRTSKRPQATFLGGRGPGPRSLQEDRESSCRRGSRATFLRCLPASIAHAASGRRRAGKGDHLQRAVCGAQGRARFRTARQHGQETRRQPSVASAPHDEHEAAGHWSLRIGLSTPRCRRPAPAPRSAWKG